MFFFSCCRLVYHWSDAVLVCGSARLKSLETISPPPSAVVAAVPDPFLFLGTCKMFVLLGMVASDFLSLTEWVFFAPRCLVFDVLSTFKPSCSAELSLPKEKNLFLTCQLLEVFFLGSSTSCFEPVSVPLGILLRTGSLSVTVGASIFGCTWSFVNTSYRLVAAFVFERGCKFRPISFHRKLNLGPASSKFSTEHVEGVPLPKCSSRVLACSSSDFLKACLLWR